MRNIHKSKKINQIKKFCNVPRYIAITALKLNLVIQPNKGSSLYQRTPQKMVKKEQRDWNSPVGTIRLSNHWNYKNDDGKLVYRTNNKTKKGVWALGINSGDSKTPWKIILVLDDSRIESINFGLLKNSIYKLQIFFNKKA